MCLLWQCLFLIVLLATVTHGTHAIKSPHIVYIMADDLGWNDVSFHGSDQIPTPNIDSLAYQGVILNRHYAQPVCTPSRAALMTGKYPIHTGLHAAFLPSQTAGLPISEKIMPNYFKEIGYVTHMIGKWHLGFYKKQFTPLDRGFDSHFGYWTGAISYYDHICEDMVRTQPNRSIFSGHDMKRNYSPAWDVVGQYATDVFTNEAIRVISNHPPDKPMFMFVAHLATHAGNQGKLLEAPQEEINRFPYISNPNRRTYAAMVSKLDQSLGNILRALEEKDMLRNSIVVFASDNGAPCIGNYKNWGSNYPFRGQKKTIWEGGIRVPAVIWSPLIKNPSRVSNELMHITDWLPTLLSAAGYNANSLLGLDGVNQWESISNSHLSPRNGFVIDISEKWQISGLNIGSLKYIKGASAFPQSPEMSKYLNFDTIFSKKFQKYSIEKILTSPAWNALQNVTKYQHLKSEIPRLRQEATIICEDSFDSTVSCDDSPCLFNIIKDPCEQKNIATKFPLLIIFMEIILNYYKLGMYPEDSIVLDPKSDPQFYNGTWSIWTR